MRYDAVNRHAYYLLIVWIISDLERVGLPYLSRRCHPSDPRDEEITHQRRRRLSLYPLIPRNYLPEKLYFFTDVLVGQLPHEKDGMSNGIASLPQQWTMRTFLARVLASKASMDERIQGVSPVKSQSWVPDSTQAETSPVPYLHKARRSCRRPWPARRA
jgi:hypothetical protein